MPASTDMRHLNATLFLALYVSMAVHVAMILPWTSPHDCCRASRRFGSSSHKISGLMSTGRGPSQNVDGKRFS